MLSNAMASNHPTILTIARVIVPSKLQTCGISCTCAKHRSCGQCEFRCWKLHSDVGLSVSQPGVQVNGFWLCERLERCKRIEMHLLLHVVCPECIVVMYVTCRRFVQSKHRLCTLLASTWCTCVYCFLELLFEVVFHVLGSNWSGHKH